MSTALIPGSFDPIYDPGIQLIGYTEQIEVDDRCTTIILFDNNCSYFNIIKDFIPWAFIEISGQRDRNFWIDTTSADTIFYFHFSPFLLKNTQWSFSIVYFR